MDQASNLRNVIKLANQRSASNARVITITSGKGGVGKSSMAVNLATHFSNLEKRVIIFDADFGLANIEVMLRCVPKYNLSDVLFGNMQMSDIIVKGPGNISFVSGGSGVMKLNNLNEAQLRRVASSLSELEALCDILIVDTGAGISNQVLDFLLSSSEVVVVTTPEPSSITDSYALLKALYNNPRFLADTRIYLVANKVGSDIEGRAVFDKMNQVVSRFLNGHIEYLGMILQDPSLEKCVRSQTVVSLEAPNAKSSKGFEEIATKLLSATAARQKTTTIAGFFNALLKRG